MKFYNMLSKEFQREEEALQTRMNILVVAPMGTDPIIPKRLKQAGAPVLFFNVIKNTYNIKSNLFNRITPITAVNIEEAIEIYLDSLEKRRYG